MTTIPEAVRDQHPSEIDDRHGPPQKSPRGAWLRQLLGGDIEQGLDEFRLRANSHTPVGE